MTDFGSTLVVQILDSIMLCAIDLGLIALLCGFLRIGDARLRAGLITLAICHGIVALFGYSPLAIARIEIAYGPDAPWIAPLTRYAPLLLGVLLASSTWTILSTAWRQHRFFRRLRLAVETQASSSMEFQLRVEQRLHTLAQLHRLKTPQLLWVCWDISPFVVGRRQPIIVFPNSLAAHLQADELDAILLHELAHLKYWDTTRNPLLELIAAGFWFHLPLRKLLQNLQAEFEIISDRKTLNWGVQPRAWIRAQIQVLNLIQKENSSQPAPLSVAGLGASSFSQGIHRQMLRRGLAISKKRCTWSRLSAQIFFILLLLPISNQGRHSIAVGPHPHSIQSQYSSRISLGIHFTGNAINRPLIQIITQSMHQH